MFQIIFTLILYFIVIKKIIKLSNHKYLTLILNNFLILF